MALVGLCALQVKTEVTVGNPAVVIVLCAAAGGVLLLQHRFVLAQYQFLFLFSVAEIEAEKFVIWLLGVLQLVDVTPGNPHVAWEALVYLFVVLGLELLAKVKDFFVYVQVWLLFFDG